MTAARKHHHPVRRVVRPARAFTLVELLVVVAIIALLIAILLPSLNKAREVAKGVLCQSNHRQLILGIQMYAEDHGQLTPSVTGKVPSPYDGGGHTYVNSSGEVSFPWFGGPLVGQYIGNPLLNGSTNSVIYCPSLNVSKMMSLSWYSGDKNRNGIGINHLYNCRLYGDKPRNSDGSLATPVRFTAIRSPSRMTILSDVSYAGHTTGYYSWGYITHDVDGRAIDGNYTDRSSQYGANFYLHNGTCTLSFADGHVQASPDVLAESKNHSITTVATQ